MLRPPAFYRSIKRSESQISGATPDIRELDILYQSLQPGVTEDERYKMQDSSVFY